MPVTFGQTASFGIAFLVAAALVDEKIAKDVSSPQTAEINIRKREGTLMKWVHIGQAEAALFIAIAAAADKVNRAPHPARRYSGHDNNGGRIPVR